VVLTGGTFGNMTPTTIPVHRCRIKKFNYFSKCAGRFFEVGDRCVYHIM